MSYVENRVDIEQKVRKLIHLAHIRKWIYNTPRHPANVRGRATTWGEPRNHYAPHGYADAVNPANQRGGQQDRTQEMWQVLQYASDSIDITIIRHFHSTKAYADQLGFIHSQGSHKDAHTPPHPTTKAIAEWTRSPHPVYCVRTEHTRQRDKVAWFRQRTVLHRLFSRAIISMAFLYIMPLTRHSHRASARVYK